MAKQKSGDVLEQRVTPLSVFLDLSREAQQLLRSVQTIQVAKNRIPVHKGDKVSGAYVVVKGCLRVFSYTPNGHESTFYLIRPGETCVFAINCLFNQLLYPAWVVAEEETEICVISGALYKQLFQTESAIQNLTIDALSSAVFKLMTEVEHLQGWNLSQRLSNLLLHQASDDNRVLMTQQEIASRLGSSREVIARLLGEMVSEGLITTGRGCISLIQPSALARLIHG